MSDSSTYPTQKGISGIYEIFCKANGKRYIGSARCFAKRKINHLAMVRNGKHTSIHFQRAWNLYGEDAFEFRVLEICEVDSLLEREQYYLDTFHPELNIAKTAGASFMGRHHSAESNLKNSTAQKARMKKGGAAIKNLIEKLTGRKTPAEVVAKIAKANTGKTRTKESKEKISRSLQGIQHSQERKASFLSGLLSSFAKAADQGCTIGKQKFNPSQISEIRRLHGEGLNYVVLAEKFNTTPSTIRSICLHLSYKHVS